MKIKLHKQLLLVLAAATVLGYVVITNAYVGSAITPSAAPNPYDINSGVDVVISGCDVPSDTVNVYKSTDHSATFFRLVCDDLNLGRDIDSLAPGPTTFDMLVGSGNCAGASYGACAVVMKGAFTWMYSGGNQSLPTPTPSPAAIAQTDTRSGVVTVAKTVINDNGGTKKISDFPLFVNGRGVTSGVANIFPAPADVYSVTETVNPLYTQSFSGDCDVNGQLNLIPGDNKFCIVTNNDIYVPVVPTTAVPVISASPTPTPTPILPVPPLISVVKVPSPLALPAGSGPVTYTYTLRNVGTVPVTDISMVGDTCGPIVLASGDTNKNAILEVNETWTYRCATRLTKTHTNTVTATGWANGLSAVDLASSTVVVGAPIVPPLINVTKIPNPLSLRAGGGAVIYTERITNPGKVALSDVQLIDDKCQAMTYISGDTNRNSLLDTTEEWVYTCSAYRTESATNTAIATGKANGLTARDVAVVTVVVAAPVAQIAPETGMTFGSLTVAGIIVSVLLLVLLFFLIRRRRKNASAGATVVA